MMFKNEYIKIFFLLLNEPRKGGKLSFFDFKSGATPLSNIELKYSTRIFLSIKEPRNGGKIKFIL